MSKPFLISPHNQDTLNYLYIPFEWTQTPATQNYQIQISNDSDFEDISISASGGNTGNKIEADADALMFRIAYGF